MAQSLAQIRKENAALRKKSTREKEMRELRAENYRLKHQKSVRFLRGAGKVSGKVGKYVYKKTLAPIPPRRGVKPLPRRKLF